MLRRPGGGDYQRQVNTPPRSRRAPKAEAGDRPALDAAEFEREAWPFYWLTRATARYLIRLETALKPAGLDVPRWRVLMSLQGQDRASVSELAEHAIVKLPTMTKIVHRPASAGRSWSWSEA